MKKIVLKNKGFVLPLVIAVVAILAIGGTVYLAEHEKAEVPVVIDTNVPVQATTTVVATTTVDTKDWKTYRNEQLGFEFKYPASIFPNGVGDGSDSTASNDTVLYLIGDDSGIRYQVNILKDDNWSSFSADTDKILSTVEIENVLNKKKYESNGNKIISGDYVYSSDNSTLHFALIRNGASAVVLEHSNIGKIGLIFEGIISNFRFITPVVEKPIACTKDAFMCPDGTYVGRSGPKCEFVCPESAAKTLIENVKITSNVNFDIKSERRILSFGPEWAGIKVRLDGYVIDNYLDESRPLKIPVLTNSENDWWNSGDATFSGATAYKNEGVICVHSYRSDDENDLYPKQKIFCADHDVPEIGEDQLLINCSSRLCDISGITNVRSDFYFTENSRIVRIKIDLETRLRDVDKTESDGSHTVIKWADFYSLVQDKNMYSATVYGDWIDTNTFKANWIIWPTP